MAELFAIAVVILALGFLWFWVVRPILIDFGLWPLSRVSTRPPNHSVELPLQTNQTKKQTDQQTTRPSAISPKPPRLALDKTRAAVLEELLTHGWTITDLRRENILRGDNATISQEVAETRKRLGLADPDRTIKIRDEKGERVIPA